MAEENKLQVFPVGITEKEIKKIADQAIADSGAANEVPLATQADAGRILKVSDAGAYELAEESTGTNVVANPVLAGTEADLTGLQVGDTKYKIPAGGSGGGSSPEIQTFSYASNNTLDMLVMDLNLTGNNAKSYILCIYITGQGAPKQIYGFFNFQYEGTGWGLYVYAFKGITVDSGFKRAYCYASTGLENYTWDDLYTSLTDVSAS